jgi:hypothetical protein
MGQEQLKTGEAKKMQEKTPPASEKDRATVPGFDQRIENNPAMKWGGKQAPLSRPT